MKGSSCAAVLEACATVSELKGFRALLRCEMPEACAAKSLGAPSPGKLADLELTLPDCSRCHIEVFEDRVEVHRDRVSPLCSPLGHLAVDAWKHVVGFQGALTLLLGLAGYGAASLLGLAALALTLVSRLLLALLAR